MVEERLAISAASNHLRRWLVALMEVGVQLEQGWWAGLHGSYQSTGPYTEPDYHCLNIIWSSPPRVGVPLLPTGCVQKDKHSPSADCEDRVLNGLASWEMGSKGRNAPPVVHAPTPLGSTHCEIKERRASAYTLNSNTQRPNPPSATTGEPYRGFHKS